MLTISTKASVARRSFLSRLGAGLSLVGAAFATGEADAQAQSVSGGESWKPRRHPQDDWLDQVAGTHRMVFDTTSPSGLGNALLYASNFFVGNQNGYQLGNGDIAVVLILRHGSTAFAYTDEMWAKYGTLLAQRINFDDPKTNKRPVINVYNSAAHGSSLPSNGNTLDALAKRGAHFGVCQMATRRLAGTIAEGTGGNAEAAYNELVAHLIPNAHIVPAGIVAVGRAQERGYALAHGG
jgi:intracellular sulfur oxidation DsrE/DsrF family protein